MSSVVPRGIPCPGECWLRLNLYYYSGVTDPKSDTFKLEAGNNAAGLVAENFYYNWPSSAFIDTKVGFAKRMTSFSSAWTFSTLIKDAVCSLIFISIHKNLRKQVMRSQTFLFRGRSDKTTSITGGSKFRWACGHGLQAAFGRRRNQ